MNSLFQCVRQAFVNDPNEPFVKDAEASLGVIESVLCEVDGWLNTPAPSGGGHIAVHASLCPDLARRVREALRGE